MSGQGFVTGAKKMLKQFGDRPLVWDTVTTTFLSTLGKSAGFLVPFFIAAWFGVSGETDAFFFAYGLIVYLSVIFAPAAESLVVPFIVDAAAKNEDVGGFVGKVIGVSSLGLTLLAALFLLAIKPILAVATQFPPDKVDLIFRLLLEAAPLVVLLVVSSVLAGTLHAHKVFSAPAVSPALRAVVTVTFIYTFRDLGVHAIAWGYVAGELARLLLLLGVLTRLNLVRLRLSVGWNKEFSEFFATTSYQMASLFILGFTPIINKTMASWLGPGKVTLLEYADRLYMVPITLIGSGFIVTLLPHWSGRFQTHGEPGLRGDVARTVRVVGAAGILLTLVFFLARQPLARLVYGHGQFPKENLADVADVLGCYLLGVTTYFVSQVYVRAFLVMKMTSVLLLMAIVMVGGTVALNYLFMHLMGLPGIALSTSVNSVITCVVIRLVFSRKLAAA